MHQNLLTYFLFTIITECADGVLQHSPPVLSHVLVVLCGVPEVLSHAVGSVVKEMVQCADNLKSAIEGVCCFVWLYICACLCACTSNAC